MELNERLKAFRKSLNLNQTEFAESLGISQVVFSRYETGIHKIPSVFVKTLCATYHIREEWFLTGEGEMMEQDDREAMLEGLFRERLPDESEEFRAAFVDALIDLDADGWNKLIDAAKVFRDLLDKTDK